MKAVRIHSFGSADVLQLDEVPKPVAGDDEVLIKVRAASVNPVDYKLRTGEFKPVGMRMPLTLGRDISGIVEHVGSAISGINVGDEVYALLDQAHGGYAEYVVAPGNGVALKPANLDHLHAAAVPLAALTAWQGLFDHGKLGPGQHVLIHGAAGGVGHFAVQFAKAHGAQVCVTARASDHELLRELGADELIDYQHERFEERVHALDLVLDLVAGETQQRSWDTLRAGGRIVSTLQPPSEVESARHRATGEAFLTRPDRAQLEQIALLIEGGKVRVLVQHALPLDEVQRAHDRLEHGHVRGKVVLAVSEAPEP